MMAYSKAEIDTAIKMVQSHNGIWDALENDCADPKNCDMPYEMHKRYWLELARSKLRMN